MRRQIITVLKKPLRERIILNNSKNNDDIIYGARSIQKQLGTISRQTEDFDIFSKNPKKSAIKTEKDLDKLYGFNYFYTKKGMHKGTYKVKSLGLDLKKDTKDDEGIADYTKTPTPIPKTRIFNNIKYRDIKEEAMAKRKSLADKNFKFRHNKDRTDLTIINTVLKSSQPQRPKIPNKLNFKKQ